MISSKYIIKSCCFGLTRCLCGSLTRLFLCRYRFVWPFQIMLCTFELEIPIHRLEKSNCRFAKEVFPLSMFYFMTFGKKLVGCWIIFIFIFQVMQRPIPGFWKQIIEYDESRSGFCLFMNDCNFVCIKPCLFPVTLDPEV